MKLLGSLVFYIGNGVVKAGLVVHEKNKAPRIVSLIVKDLPHHEERDREHLEKRILSEFNELVTEFKNHQIKNLLDKGISVSIKNALVLLSSPWYISETSIIKMKEQKPFVVTEQLIEKAKDDIIKGYRDAHKLDVTVLEQKIINIILNGYPTTEPLRKKVQTLDMNIFTSFARKSSVDQIKDIINKNFHTTSTTVHSQSIVSFSVISNIWREMLQYIIVDVTSQLTELVAIRKGTLSEAYSFPKGKQFLVRIISEGLSVSTEVAESMIRMKNNGEIDADLDTKISTFLKKANDEWLKDFSNSLRVMSGSTSLPNSFFLFAPKDVSHIFSEYISSEEYQQFSFAEGKFIVKALAAQDFSPYAKNESDKEADLSLTLGAIYSGIII